MFGVGGEDEAVVRRQLRWIRNDALDMLALLHVTLASVVVMTNMAHLLIHTILMIQHSLLQVLRVWELVAFMPDIAVLFGQIFQDFMLLSHIFVIWINKHELVVIRQVEILVDFQILMNDIELDTLLVNQELWVFVGQEWSEFLVLVSVVHAGVVDVVDVLHLCLIITAIHRRLVEARQISWAYERHRLECIESDEGVIHLPGLILLNMRNLLNGIRQHTHCGLILLNWLCCVRQREHLHTLWLVAGVRGAVLLANYELLVEELF